MNKENSLTNSMFSALNKADISYCVWKNAHELDEAFAGKDDFDILVKRHHIGRFTSVILGMGFKEASSNKINYPFISHYYGYDSETNVLIHLHIHTRLMTGESHTKNYHLPFEDEILSSVNSSIHGVPVSSVSVQYSMFLLRYYIKASCIPGVILLHQRKKSISDEYMSIANNYRNSSEEREINLAHDYLPDSLLKKMVTDFESVSPTLHKFLIGQQVRFYLRYRLRYSNFMNLWERYWQIMYRALNKLFFKARKKISTGGSVLIITGSDGAGKSTISKKIVDWLGSSFDVRHYHMGRPPATIITFLYRLVLVVFRGVKKAEKSKGSTLKNKRATLIRMLHYLVIAYERRSLAKRIERKRNQGYIVVCDRYTTTSIGVMDSPRVRSLENGNILQNKIALFEEAIYRQIPKVDLNIFLNVPLETIIERNKMRVKKDKESDEEIITRFEELLKVSYSANKTCKIDASGSLDDTLNHVKKIVWAYL